LWDSNHKKLYVSNGTISPTLIGPIQADWNAAAGSPGEILNKPTIPSTDRNDEIHDFGTTVSGEISDEDSGLTLYTFGSPSQNITQYWLNLSQGDITTEPYFFIDLFQLFSTVGLDKKVTLFVTGALQDGDHLYENTWEYTKFPLFWMSDEGQALELGYNKYNYRIWDSGTKVFDTWDWADYYTSGTGPISIKNVYQIQGAADDLLNGTKFILENAKNGNTIKLELIPFAAGDMLTVDIHATYPTNRAVTVTPHVGLSNTSTLIATINGTNIYCPVVNGYLTVDGILGCAPVTGALVPTIQAALTDYTPIGYIGSSTSTSDANITAVGLTESGAPYNENKLCIKESSAFGSGGTVTFDGVDEIEWSLAPYSRSYNTVLLGSYNGTAVTPDSIVNLIVSDIASACQTDHYLYIFNDSQTTVTVRPSYTTGDWSPYSIVGIPNDTTLLPNTGVEVSMALRRYDTSSLNTAVMTASEPLRAQ
jgi:hypothetical protein